ncbi:hypothetical protein JP39_01400 [Companilactobacillus heilongjiangensis]|uniref:Uncharacterized protein n=1 Tax=Companilactobacillus heilongjiangensis TaxID=1074467 RepID=A0A0K2LA10_9LACO|nr:hypothetical protein JP39_01400 [Companilactobacillus heilongjiangensis]
MRGFKSRFETALWLELVRIVGVYSRFWRRHNETKYNQKNKIKFFKKAFSFFALDDITLVGTEAYAYE